MNKRQLYLAWISEKEQQKRILAELDRLAKAGPIDELTGLGICAHLEKVTLGGWAYAFVATHSDNYRQFCPPYTNPSYARWQGPNYNYRREWCRKFAEALRADRSLFLQPPTEFSLQQ